MALACKFCIMQYGLRGSEIDSLPQTEEELIEHIERIHHMPVVREGENKEQAEARFLLQYPEAVDCLDCQKAGAVWSTIIL